MLYTLIKNTLIGKEKSREVEEMYECYRTNMRWCSGLGILIFMLNTAVICVMINGSLAKILTFIAMLIGTVFTMAGGIFSGELYGVFILKELMKQVGDIADEPNTEN